MATSLDQIEGFLRARQYNCRREDDKNWIVAPFEYEHLNPLIVVVMIEEDGRFVKIFAPRLFKYIEGPYKLLLMQTMLLISWETKMLQWEYDPIDGEVRGMVEFPVEDSILTEAQFFRAFDGLVQLVMMCYPRLKSVLSNGIDPGREGKARDDDKLTRAFLDFLKDKGYIGSGPPEGEGGESGEGHDPPPLGGDPGDDAPDEL